MLRPHPKWIATAMVGSSLLIASVGCRNGPALYAGPPAGHEPGVAPTAASRRVDACPSVCPKENSWAGIVSDPVLLRALKLAYDEVRAIRPLVDGAMLSGVRIVIEAPSDPDSLGVFEGKSRLIKLSPGVLRELAVVIAAVIVHELVHAAQPPDSGVNACFSHEVEAYAWQAETYEALRTGLESTPLAAFQDQLVESWHAGRLEALVHSWPLYQRQCFGTTR